MKDVGIITINDQYPFNSKIIQNSNYSKIICHQIIQFNNQNKTQKRTKIIKKIKTLLTHQFNSSIIIQIQSVVQQENSISIFYQYVHKKANQWIYTLDTKRFYKIKQQFINFANLLAQFKIITQLDFYNLGVTEDQKIKYFLGLDFDINQNLSKEHIRSVYIKNINEIFQPIQTQLRQEGKIMKKSYIQDKTQKLDMQNYMFLPTQFAPDEGDIIAPLSVKQSNSSSNRQKSKSVDILDVSSNLRLTTKSVTKSNHQILNQQNAIIIKQQQLQSQRQNILRGNVKPELLESVKSVGNDRKINNSQKKIDEQKQQKYCIRLSDKQQKFSKKQPESLQDEAINRIKRQEYQNLKNAKGSYYQDFANILDNDEGQFGNSALGFKSSKSIKANQSIQLSATNLDNQRLIKQKDKQMVEADRKSQNQKIEQNISNIKGRAANAIQQSQKIMQKLRNIKIIKN